MKSNVGKVDKMLRIVLGIAAIAAGVYFKTWWGALGVVFLATALINWCPLYVPFRIRTCKK